MPMGSGIRRTPRSWVVALATMAAALGNGGLFGGPPLERGCVETLPSLPIALSNNAVASVDNGDGTFSLYSFMGITDPTDEGSISAASFRFDWPGIGWAPIADAPRLNGLAKIGANAVVVAGEVYLVGGYTVTRFFEVTEHRLFRYDADVDMYTELAEVPVEVDDTVACVYEDRYLYLVSGWHGPLSRNVPNVQVYDTQTDTWEQATAIPGPGTGLFGHAGAIIGDRIVYMDGVRSVGGFPISDRVFVGRIDPDETGDVTSIEWQEVAAHPGLPTYRAAGSQGGTGDGRFVLLGGTDNPYNFNGTGYNGQPAHPLAQLLTYEPSADTWTSLDVFGPHVPTMDHRGLVRLDDGWATMGGMTGPGQSTDAVYHLRLTEEVTGDLNCDGVTGVGDLLIMFANWGPCPDPPAWCPADLDDDGVVGISDLLLLFANWG